MGNSISKISKDRLLGLEEFMKNKTSLEKGKAGPSLDRITGGTYTRIHFIRSFQKMKHLLHHKLGCGGETFFKTG